MKSRVKSQSNRPLVNLKLVVGILTGILIVILAISFYFVIDDASRSVTIRFMVAPSSAKITLNGTEYQSATTYKITPGDYTLLIEKPGFESYEKQISPVENDNLNISIALSVQPGNENYYKEHPNEAYALETIWTDQMVAGSDIVFENNPLFKILPIDVEYYVNNQRYVHYQITFSIDTPERTAVLINDYTGGNYEAALERIRTEGYNPDNYTIEYHNLTEEYTGTDNF